MAACAGDQQAPGTTSTSASGSKPGYGPLVEGAGAALMLPAGFRYVSFGRAGSEMSDGLPTPTCHDGTGVFSDKQTGVVKLLRNHEGYHPRKALGKPGDAYDRTAQGGVTVSRFDTGNGELLDSALLLSGTDNNCNGGVTPWGTWLSGEEATLGKEHGFDMPHGYMFEVPADAKGPVEAVPIKAMGRFCHEAAPVDPKTGIVYMTEDNGDPGDGFYRYVTDTKGKLHGGGTLEMLTVKGEKNYDTVTGQKVGRKLECGWVPIKDPDPSDANSHPDAVYQQGFEQGAANFLAPEGAFFHQGSVYFNCSEGGDAEYGQVWKFTPDPKDHDTGELTLLYESPGQRELDEPDAITVSPRGGVLICEDGNGGDPGGDNFIRGLTPDGKLYEFAKNIEPMPLHDDFTGHPQPLDERHWTHPDRPDHLGASEFSGAAFSPDGKWLFVHVQYPGETFAITGPWERGWL